MGGDAMGGALSRGPKHIDFNNLEEELAKIGTKERDRRTFAFDRDDNMNKDFEFDSDDYDRSP